jgi:hypothetical protein
MKTYTVELSNLLPSGDPGARIARASFLAEESTPLRDLIPAAKEAIGIRPSAKTRQVKIRNLIEIRFPSSAGLIAYLES